ncbi:hypothetical protein [Nocardia sp. NBC_01327]|uniref:hypothetical protein n=1 Tax=Nocardia sp. NBC_01327 TaxID=2903593 RepID=UPI002E1636A9|nr:hypothetical protein OG326_28355 [Nocardia sp. NBC_01327]
MPATMDDPSGNSPGLTLAAIGIVSIALTLTIGGYGFAMVALLGAAVSGLCLALGITLVVAEHNRDCVRKQHRTRCTGNDTH